MKTTNLVFLLSSLLAISSCKTDLGVDPIEQELRGYEVLLARNTTQLNAPGGTGRAIYLVNADGSNMQGLSQHPEGGYPGVGNGFDSSPQFSPDGNLIAFQTNRQGNQELYVMQADGSNKNNITNASELDLEFNWSPDGAKLVFTRLVQDKYVLYVVGANGSGLSQLTAFTDDCRYPAWSPNGQEIAFSRFISGTARRQIFLMNADGSNLRAISDASDNALSPQWSKDGSRIYYFVAGFGMRVKSVDASFSNSLAGFFPRTLSWSPDGQWFVESDSLSIVKIAADLSSFSRISVNGFEPRVSSDGHWILFLRSNASGAAELHVARVDGRDERRLIDSQFGDLFPSWRPM